MSPGSTVTRRRISEDQGSRWLFSASPRRAVAASSSAARTRQWTCASLCLSRSRSRWLPRKPVAPVSRIRRGGRGSGEPVQGRRSARERSARIWSRSSGRAVAYGVPPPLVRAATVAPDGMRGDGTDGVSVAGAGLDTGAEAGLTPGTGTRTDGAAGTGRGRVSGARVARVVPVAGAGVRAADGATGVPGAERAAVVPAVASQPTARLRGRASANTSSRSISMPSSSSSAATSSTAPTEVPPASKKSVSGDRCPPGTKRPAAAATTAARPSASGAAGPCATGAAGPSAAGAAGPSAAGAAGAGWAPTPRSVPVPVPVSPPAPGSVPATVAVGAVACPILASRASTPGPPSPRSIASPVARCPA